MTFWRKNEQKEGKGGRKSTKLPTSPTLLEDSFFFFVVNNISALAYLIDP